MSISYKDLISLLKSECEKINIKFSSDGDGHITSAIKEKEYLDILVKYIQIIFYNFLLNTSNSYYIHFFHY